jgi:hypothetical protein
MTTRDILVILLLLVAGDVLGNLLHRLFGPVTRAIWQDYRSAYWNWRWRRVQAKRRDRQRFAVQMMLRSLTYNRRFVREFGRYESIDEALQAITSERDAVDGIHLPCPMWIEDVLRPARAADA